MMIFVSMDKMIGGDFEKGLAKLKEIAERDERERVMTFEEIKLEQD